MFLIALFAVNEAGNAMLQIACTMALLKKHQEPTATTFYMCIIAAPEAFQFLLAIFVDSVSIYGKKGHIILAACLQFAFSAIIVLFDRVPNL